MAAGAEGLLGKGAVEHGVEVLECGERRRFRATTLRKFHRLFFQKLNKNEVDWAKIQESRYLKVKLKKYISQIAKSNNMDTWTIEMWTSRSIALHCSTEVILLDESWPSLMLSFILSGSSLNRGRHRIISLCNI